MIYISFDAKCNFNPEEQYRIRENFCDCVDVIADVTIEPAKRGHNLYVVSICISGDDWREYEVFSRDELLDNEYTTHKLFCYAVLTVFWRYKYYNTNNNE